jgi:hypothetical protein
LLAQTQRIDFGDGAILVDAVVVYDLSLNQVTPLIALAIVSGLLLMGTVGLAGYRRLQSCR